MSDGAIEGSAEGRKEGSADGRKEGSADGRKEGAAEGMKEGSAEGRKEGSAEGRAEGLPDLCVHPLSAGPVGSVFRSRRVRVGSKFRQNTSNRREAAASKL